MIKINTSEIDKFAVELVELSEKNRDNVQKAIKKSAFNIESQAKKNLASNKSFFILRPYYMSFSAFFNAYSILNIRSMYSCF